MFKNHCENIGTMYNFLYIYVKVTVWKLVT